MLGANLNKGEIVNDQNVALLKVRVLARYSWLLGTCGRGIKNKHVGGSTTGKRSCGSQGSSLLRLDLYESRLGRHVEILFYDSIPTPFEI